MGKKNIRKQKSYKKKNPSITCPGIWRAKLLIQTGSKPYRTTEYFPTKYQIELYIPHKPTLIHVSCVLTASVIDQQGVYGTTYLQTRCIGCKIAYADGGQYLYNLVDCQIRGLMGRGPPRIIELARQFVTATY